MPPLPFSDITYLHEGTQKQRRAYEVLIALQIFDKLKGHSPVLTGTIPLDIDIESSDLDIICHWQDQVSFTSLLELHWGDRPDFQMYHTTLGSQPTVLARFREEEFELEIVGQNRSPYEQEAYRHMLREYEILQKMGPIFKEQIRELKKNGIKTEPAFARLLGLKGDPYQALLDYEF